MAASGIHTFTVPVENGFILPNGILREIATYVESHVVDAVLKTLGLSQSEDMPGSAIQQVNDYIEEIYAIVMKKDIFAELQDSISERKDIAEHTSSARHQYHVNSFCYISARGDWKIDGYGAPTSLSPYGLGGQGCWFQATLPANWTMIFTHNLADPLYGLDYYITHKQDEVLEAARKQTDNYRLQYQRDGVPIFDVNVYKYVDSGAWYAKFSITWHYVPELPEFNPPRFQATPPQSG